MNFTGTIDTTQTPGPRFFQPNSFFNTGTLFALNNTAGNVGIVAGTAGLTRGGQPASDGVTGSVQNITASSIMSIVAGSVDRVAPVQLLSNIVATNIGGVLGADKSLNPAAGPLFGGPDGRIQFYDQNGNITSSLQAGYRLARRRAVCDQYPATVFRTVAPWPTDLIASGLRSVPLLRLLAPDACPRKWPEHPGAFLRVRA